MSSFRVKIASLLLDELVLGPNPMDPWEAFTRRAAARRGSNAMEVPLVPGFDATYRDLLGGGDPEVAKDVNERKRDARRGRKAWNTLRKLAEDTWEYEAGGRQLYDVDTGPGAGRDFSPQRDLDNRTGIEIAWEQVGPDFYRESLEPEPSIRNDKAAEWEHATVDPDSGSTDIDREIATLFSQNETRNPLTPEQFHELQKSAVTVTMDHAVGMGGSNDPDVIVEDKLDPQARNPGRTRAWDREWRPSEEVWDEHEAFTTHPADYAIVDSIPNPGPVP